jgi:hypothetical protein
MRRPLPRRKAQRDEIVHALCGLRGRRSLLGRLFQRRQARRRHRVGPVRAPRSPDSGRLRGKPALRPSSAAGRRGRAVGFACVIALNPAGALRLRACLRTDAEALAASRRSREASRTRPPRPRLARRRTPWDGRASGRTCSRSLGGVRAERTCEQRRRAIAQPGAAGPDLPGGALRDADWLSGISGPGAWLGAVERSRARRPSNGRLTERGQGRTRNWGWASRARASRARALTGRRREG